MGKFCKLKVGEFTHKHEYVLNHLDEYFKLSNIYQVQKKIWNQTRIYSFWSIHLSKQSIHNVCLLPSLAALRWQFPFINFKYNGVRYIGFENANVAYLDIFNSCWMKFSMCWQFLFIYLAKSCHRQLTIEILLEIILQ